MCVCVCVSLSTPVGMLVVTQPGPHLDKTPQKEVTPQGVNQRFAVKTLTETSSPSLSLLSLSFHLYLCLPLCLGHLSVYLLFIFTQVHTHMQAHSLN